MFETVNFANQLEDVVSQEAGNAGLVEYEVRIPADLQLLAANNEPSLMEQEVRKTASQRRGIPEALNSARELIKLASAYAVSENRKRLTQEDVQKAYRAKFCQIWPFCK